MSKHNLVIIATVGRNREIGCDGKLLWRFKEDMQYFRNVTMGHYVMMGRKTFDSMPKDLDGRKYLVLSRKLQSSTNVKTFAGVDDFLQFANQTDEDIYIIGGGELYTVLLQCADKMILTEVDAVADHADVFFPKFDKSNWSVKTEGTFTSSGGVKYIRKIYTKR
jgi:dihydrofolate reductase